MKQQVSASGKWIGKLLLHLIAYAVLSYIVRYMIGGSFRFLIRAGVNLPPQLLFQHFLVVESGVGFLAGLMGLALLRAMFLLPTNFNIASATGWRDPKAWIWIAPTIVLVAGIGVWMGAQSSALTTSRVSFSSFFATFFGNGCDLRNGPVGACLTQITYTHTWVGTIGYSASAFLPRGRHQVEQESKPGNLPELNSDVPLSSSGEKLQQL